MNMQKLVVIRPNNVAELATAMRALSENDDMVEILDGMQLSATAAFHSKRCAMLILSNILNYWKNE